MDAAVRCQRTSTIKLFKDMSVYDNVPTGLNKQAHQLPFTFISAAFSLRSRQDHCNYCVLGNKPLKMVCIENELLVAYNLTDNLWTNFPVDVDGAVTLAGLDIVLFSNNFYYQATLSTRHKTATFDVQLMQGNLFNCSESDYDSVALNISGYSQFMAYRTRFMPQTYNVPLIARTIVMGPDETVKIGIFAIIVMTRAGRNRLKILRKSVKNRRLKISFISVKSVGYFW